MRHLFKDNADICRYEQYDAVPFCFPIFALALSASSSAELTAPKLDLHNHTQVKTERVTIGSVADISSNYENGKPITVVRILEFRTDVFPREPMLLQVPLCGYLSERLAPAVHTNITLIYDLASQSRLTGCLRLLSAEPWQEPSRWQTVTFAPSTIKRSVELEKQEATRRPVARRLATRP